MKLFTWNEEKKHIDVRFTYNKGNFDGNLVEIKHVATIYDKKSKAEWRTQLYHKMKFPYVIMELAHDYSYAVIGMPNREYVWILGRKPTLEDDTYETLKGRIAEQGFDISKLEKVPQTMLRH